MDIEKTYDKLLALDPGERLGYQYFKATGQLMDYGHIQFLPQYLRSSDPLEAALSPSAQAESMRSRQYFERSYRSQGLSEQDFFSEDRDIEIQQLYRYFYIPAHKHNFIELVYVLSGHCTHTIGEFHTTHSVGDFVIVPPGVRHELLPEDNCVCLTTQMRQSTFLNAFSEVLRGNSLLSSYFSQVLDLPYYNCALSFHCGQDSFIRHTLLSAYQQQEDNRAYSDSLIKALLQAMFSYVMQNYQETVEFLATDSVQRGKMVEVLNYIFENYQYITLSGAAEYFHFSVPYFSTMIRTQTGKTFSELLKSYKLQRAAELLIQTNLKLDMVCDEVGYKNTAQFIRSFKEVYHCTPGQYRLKMKTNL